MYENPILASESCTEVSSSSLWNRVPSELDGRPFRVGIGGVESVGCAERREGRSGVGVASEEKKSGVGEAVKGGLNEIERESGREEGEGRGC